MEGVIVVVVVVVGVVVACVLEDRSLSLPHDSLPYKRESRDREAGHQPVLDPGILFSGTDYVGRIVAFSPLGEEAKQKLRRTTPIKWAIGRSNSSRTAT